jgi:hypothetical protein
MTGSYWLRIGLGNNDIEKCDGPNLNTGKIRGIFNYEGVSGPPVYPGSDELPTGCFDEFLVVPHVKTVVPEEVPQSLTLGFTNTATEDGLVQWLINDSLMSTDPMNPTLQHLIDRNDTWDATANLYDIGSGNKVRDPAHHSPSSLFVPE